MNCTDRAGLEEPFEKNEKSISISIPVHKIWSWYRDWRARKNSDAVREYEDIVRDYKQDQ